MNNSVAPWHAETHETVQRMALRFYPVGRVGDIEDADLKRVKAGSATAILINLGGEYFALNHLCTHEAVSLADGIIEDGQIECPKHSGRFDIRTGRALTAPCTVDARCYPVRRDGDTILIGVEEADPA